MRRDDDRLPWWQRIDEAPWWAFALVGGLPVGVALATIWAVTGASVLVSIGVGAAASVASGLVLVATFGWARQRQRRDVGPLPPGKERQTRRVAFGQAPVPEDEEVRAAAQRVASHHLARLLKLRFLWILICVVAGVEMVYAFTTGRWFPELAGVSLMVIVAAQMFQARQLRRRLAELRDPANHGEPT